METRYHQPVRISALIVLLILTGCMSGLTAAAKEVESMPNQVKVTPTPTTAPPRMQSTPTPSATPTPYPRNTYCDIIFGCALFTYDAQQGQTVPVMGALVETDGPCGYDSWYTDSSGWCDIFYANSSFYVTLDISASGYYSTSVTASSWECPLRLGLSPIDPIPTPTPIFYHHGDCNLDGALTSADAQLAFSITLGAYTPSAEQRYAADCNGNGDVTAEDAQLIFGAVLGMAFCQDAIATPTPTPNRNANPLQMGPAT